MGIYRSSPPHPFSYRVEVNGPAGEILYRLYPISNFAPLGYRVHCETQVLSNNFDQDQPSSEARTLIETLKECEDLYTSDFWGHSTEGPRCGICRARCDVVRPPGEGALDDDE